MLRQLHKTQLVSATGIPSLKKGLIYLGATRISSQKFSTTNPSRRESEGEWLHKLDYGQEIFNYGHRRGTRNNTPVYTLHSRKPLLHDDIQKAVEHVVKRASIFNIVIRERDGELWWNMQDKPKVDFKMYKQGKSLYDVQEDMWREGFDEVNGPLWRTCLMEADEEDKYVTPEIKKDYPHRYYLVSNPHHGLVDGQTSALFSTPLITAINAVIEGDPLDKIIPFGEFVPNIEYIEADNLIKEKLLKDPVRLDAMKQAVIKSSKKPYLLDYYTPPKTDRAISEHYFIEIDPNIVKRFSENCKQKGITYGTSLQTVTSTAYVEMLQEAGAADDAFDISVNMAIDSRRYLKKRALPILGMHARQMASVANIGKNPRDRFWENCHDLQKINKDLLKSGSAIEQEVIREHFLPKTPASEYYKSAPPPTRDYGFNSVGNLDLAIKGEGKHVQISHIVSYQAVHDYVYPFYQQLFTYRGNDINMISYDSARVSEDTMNQIFDRIKSIFAQFAK